MRSDRLARYRRLARIVRGRLREQQSLEVLRAEGADIGEGVFLGRGSSIDPGFAWLVSIGAYTTIARNVEIIAHDASMKRAMGFTRVAPVTIGTKVYVGSASVILPGAVIGDGSVIGAASVVTGEIPANSLALGSPARVVADVEAFAERHRERHRVAGMLAELGWRKGTPPTPAEAAVLRRRIAEKGEAYVR